MKPTAYFVILHLSSYIFGLFINLKVRNGGTIIKHMNPMVETTVLK